MKVTRPFADQGNYVAIHKVCFDLIMPNVSHTAWKVLCFVIRKTEGYGKDLDFISYSQIREGTGIRNDLTVRSALMELQGMIKTEQGWERDFTLPAFIVAYQGDGVRDPHAYTLNRECELYENSGPNSRTTKNVVATKNVETITRVPKSKSNRELVRTYE